MSKKKLIVLASIVFLALVFCVSPVWAATNDLCCSDGGSKYMNRLQAYVYDVDTDKPIRGAEVIFAGPGSYQVKDYTNSKGKTSEIRGANIAGNYTATASIAPYKSESVSLSLESKSPYECAPIVIRIGLKKSCEPSLKVFVYDKDTNNPIGGASVSLSGPGSYSAEDTTVVTGWTDRFAGLQPGSYTASVIADGYDSGIAEKNIGENDCGQLELKVGLKAKPCDRVISVYVYDQDTNNPISGAIVILGGPELYSSSGKTGSDGWTGLFEGELEPGEYSASATATGYHTGSAVTFVGENDCGQLEIKIGLKKDQCEDSRSLQIYVYNSTTNTPIASAAVTVTGPNYYSANGVTDSNGILILTGPLKDGFYTANVISVAGATGSGSVTFNGNICGKLDIRIGLKLCCPNCNSSNSFQVIVYDDVTNKPIRGAKVLITGPGGYSVCDYTNSKGKTGVLKGANTYGTYHIEVSMDGYSNKIRSVTVGQSNYGEHIVTIRLNSI
ncbi:MAG: carboxypeptidase regulatory-like domain-containing protein [Desulfotomaculaceae bacterium]|nr:carboxypeptidase regulatory-like domain-containing protein [Desulfotomaculaceae bacterium]